MLYTEFQIFSIDLYYMYFNLNFEFEV
jgi:hypothetical protein